MIASTLAHALSAIAEEGDTAARLDRWAAAAGLGPDEALQKILEIPLPSGEVGREVIRWYLGRAHPTPLSMEFAAVVLRMSIPDESTLGRVAAILRTAYTESGLAAPPWLSLLASAAEPTGEEA